MRAFKTLLFRARRRPLLGVLVYRVGPEPILQALSRLTWWQCILVCLPYGLSTALDTLGWRFRLRARPRAPFSAPVRRAACAGESLNLVAAVGPVPGEAAKAWPRPPRRLLRGERALGGHRQDDHHHRAGALPPDRFWSWPGTPCRWASDLLRAMLWLLAAEVIAGGRIRVGAGDRAGGTGGRLLRVVGVRDSTEYAESLDRALRHYYSREWRRLGLSIGFHLLGWLVAPLETVIVLWALGIDASVVTAIVIETLASGVRFATFLIPASLGALEAANAAAFAALGFGRRCRPGLHLHPPGAPGRVDRHRDRGAHGHAVDVAPSRGPRRARSFIVRRQGQPVDKSGGGCYPERCSHLARRLTGGIAHGCFSRIHRRRQHG